jgi:hypothetical protein
MRRSVCSVALIALAGGGPAHAQSPSSCAPALADACQKAADFYTYLFPQLGTALAGGHPVLGANDVFAGLGHFSVGLRVSAVRGSFADPRRIPLSTTGRVASSISTGRQVTPAPALDAAIGLFTGFALGVTHVGGVDALVSFSYLPPPNSENSEYDVPDGNTRIAIGGRVGVLEESILIPGLALAVLRRPVPTVTLRTSSADATNYGVENLEVDVNAWRMIASKSFASFGLSGGIGGDRYQSTGFAVASNPALTPQSERIALDRSVTRRTWFVAIAFELGPVQVGAEYGGASSGAMTTFNAFSPPADAPRRFASVGLRLGR